MRYKWNIIHTFCVIMWYTSKRKIAMFLLMSVVCHTFFCIFLMKWNECGEFQIEYFLYQPNMRALAMQGFCFCTNCLIQTLDVMTWTITPRNITRMSRVFSTWAVMRGWSDQIMNKTQMYNEVSIVLRLTSFDMLDMWISI